MSQRRTTPDAPQASNNIIYTKARPQDLDSLTTIFPRAFHPVNPYMAKLCPDTLAIRAWWHRIYSSAILDPAYHILIALDITTDTVVGSVLLISRSASSPFGGFLAENIPTPDHDPQLYKETLAGLARNEERVVGNVERWLVEVVAVDRAFQGRGIGKRLMGWVCEVVDAEGGEKKVFLESTKASEFYVGLGLGFEVVEVEGPEGRDGKRSRVLVREPVVSAAGRM